MLAVFFEEEKTSRLYKKKYLYCELASGHVNKDKMDIPVAAMIGERNPYTKGNTTLKFLVPASAPRLV